MRLTSDQIEAIRESAREAFCDQVRVWLFGSRTDDGARGGDIDLLVAPRELDAAQALRSKIRFLARLERRLGERKIDVVVEIPGDRRPIVGIAHATGVRLQ